MTTAHQARGSVLQAMTVEDDGGQTWEMERVACPLCGDEASEAAHYWDSPYPAIPMRFTIGRCAACGFKFTNPRLSPAALGQYYAGESPYAEPSYHALDAVRPRYERFLDSLARHGLTEGSLLEIGCDKGQFLAIARERGFDVEGVEPSSSADLGRQEYDLPIRRQAFDDAELADGAYNGVIMLDVLEHMHQPLACLEKVHAVLADSGMLLLKVPNVRHEYGLYPRLRGRAALGFGAHEHLCHFSRRSLEQALAAAKLEVVAWLGFVPLSGRGAVGKLASTLACWLGRGIACALPNWPDYNLSLVCLARKNTGSPT